MKKEGNWDEKRPGTGERLAGRFSVHSSGDSLGGLPELTTADFSAAVGAVEGTLQRIVLGAKYGDWPQDRAQLREIVLRRSWAAWQEHKHDGNLNVPLNAKISDLVLSDWYLPLKQRKSVGNTARAKMLGVDPRRYNREIKSHHRDLVGWLDVVTSEALIKVKRLLRK